MAVKALDKYVTSHLVTAQVTGHCLHGAVYLPFGDLNKPEDWFRPDAFGSVKLRLTGAAGVAPTKLLLQQLRT